MNDEDKFKAELFWKLYSEHCVQGRHHESQRSTVIGVILAVAAAITGILTFDKGVNGASDAALSCFLIFLGIFGAGFSLKHYERFNLHMNRARSYRNAIDDMLSDHPIARLKRDADLQHNADYPRMARVRLHRWWVTLNLAVSLLGAVLFTISVWFPVHAP